MLMNMKKLWEKYNKSTIDIVNALGRTNNVVGEYAEYLSHQYYGGELQEASNHSYDILGEDGKKYQVKSRRIKKKQSVKLNIIRSWNFDYLVVVLFDDYGKIIKAVEAPKRIVKNYAKEDKHQNGSVLYISKTFLDYKNVVDITQDLRNIN
jgi:hypothetical protein